MTRPRSNADFSQTIFALSSGKLPSAIAIEKLSGPQSFEFASRLFTPEGGSCLTKTRGFSYGVLRDLAGNKIDSCLALTFVAPHSHTGQDSVEFHVHGSVGIVSALEKSLLSMGAVPAAPGEFSYRALLNERTTPEEIERLGDLFASDTPTDVAAIWERTEGSLAGEIATFRSELLRVQAILDTAVDFSDEYSDVLRAAEYPIERVVSGCSRLLERFDIFSGVGRRPTVTLFGKPNAGKSSLFNAVLGRVRTLVSPAPGTTRDVVAEELMVGNRVWTIQDTAGIRDDAGELESAGIGFARASLSRSALRVLVVDATQGLSAEDLLSFEDPSNRPDIIAWNKIDLDDVKPVPSIGIPVATVSAENGSGISELKAALDKLAEKSPLAHVPLITHVQRARLARVVEGLQEIRIAIRGLELPEIISEKNRRAMSDLEVVIGAISNEDVLDRLFGEFCIGK